MFAPSRRLALSRPSSVASTSFGRFPTFASSSTSSFTLPALGTRTYVTNVKRIARREKRRLAEKALVKAEAEKQATEAAVAATKQQVDAVMEEAANLAHADSSAQQQAGKGNLDRDIVKEMDGNVRMKPRHSPLSAA
ncbi:uncharacterized protein ACA1_159020 [Acanthamoeba castellanii str. Neff]|uniref:Uncharacterized protein n=1 Tax=Acanthamoeba castellanii (strain ATCC 30010 / Neff) TaxID=1257118 RepID=L8HCM8_ACACF|nr:uncharacterized protein ACA1_159020 [Acanthamoeba castellanii str. Neff]ELR22106.1 hypothetical protein ACA1_159020 [Acanthamoeba castellanii str. Neff]